MQIQLLILPVISFFIASLNITGLRIIARQIGLVDKPNFRKVHLNPIPLIGGLSIIISSVLTIVISLGLSNLKVYADIFMCAMILHIVGILDDRYDIRASYKLIIEMLLAHYLYTQGIKIEGLHGIFGIFYLPDYFQYLLTILVITGVVNAFNLMDGIDGLAAGLSIFSFIIFVFLSYLLGNGTFMLIFSTFAGATLAFLFYNFSKNKKVFMGDAGSLTIGFILAVSGIILLQSTNTDIPMSHVALGIIFVFIIPVLDALRVFRKRIKDGKNPFKADKTHLHHLVLNLGFKHKKATACILLFMICIMGFGFLGFIFFNLTFSILLIFFIFYLVLTLLQFNTKCQLWKQRILLLEKNK